MTSRVLIADDEARSRHTLSVILKEEGHVLIMAETGAETLATVLRELPDVILLDINMPGMDGVEVCRRLKENPETAPIPILMVTGMTEREERLRAIAAGANDFITKPVDAQELILRVRNAASLKRMYDELQRKYAELKVMAELGQNLSRMIHLDTQTMAALLASPGAQAGAVPPPDGKESHGRD